ncbi:hypothetical protein OFC38_35430, partial [Escherichia coli]|nr:hypothetical protein [Escherichia coli]
MAQLEFAEALRRGRPSKAHTQSMNVYRLAVLAGLPTAHGFFILSFFLSFFFFFNIFYKKKILYVQYIYVDFYNHS